MHRFVPDAVRRLFWDVDPDAIELGRDRDYVMERIMTRGTWEAMGWLKVTYSKQEMTDFLARKGERLPPRDRAYWSLITGCPLPATPGGGRPAWAG